ncbi:hypothetical protein GCM10020229_63100 [Kitasatospora albolonga]
MLEGTAVVPGPVQRPGQLGRDGGAAAPFPLLGELPHGLAGVTVVGQVARQVQVRRTDRQPGLRREGGQRAFGVGPVAGGEGEFGLLQQELRERCPRGQFGQPPRRLLRPPLGAAVLASPKAAAASSVRAARASR